MSYNNNVPQSGQSLGDTRADINTNFSLIKTISDVNHVNYGAAGQGKHKFVQMRGITAAGQTVTTAGDEGALYVNTGTFPEEQNLFFMAQSTGKIYQLTHVNSAADAMNKFGVNTVDYVGTNSGGWTFLPGGLLFQYGKLVLAGTEGGTVTVTYPIQFSNSTAPYSISASIQRGTSGSVTIKGSITHETFVCIVTNTSGNPATIHWQAIGP